MKTATHVHSNITLFSFALLVRSCVVVGLFLTCCISSASTPVHRYSFDGTANDSVGSAHGTLVGGAVITNGALVLNGTNGLLQLPDNLFTNSRSLTLEVWFLNTKQAPLQHLWSFSGSPSINYLLEEDNLLHLTPRRPGCYYGETGSTSSLRTVQWRMTDALAHLVWTQDEPSTTARIYFNGVVVGEHTNFVWTPGPTTNGFLGGKELSSPIEGRILEFRIYSNAITHLEVLQSDVIGPDIVPIDQDPFMGLSLRLPSHVGLGSLTKPLIYADFDHVEDVNITHMPTIGYGSDNTNVINIDADGRLSANTLGSADITASYGGLMSTVTVTVVDAAQFPLVHRYDFAGKLGDTNVSDLIGGAHGSIFYLSTPQPRGGAFTNAGQLFMPGSDRTFVELPDGILSSLNEVTIEAWVTGLLMDSLFWVRVFDFGDSPNGSYFFLAPAVNIDYKPPYPENFTRFAVTTNNFFMGEVPRLTGQPPALNHFEVHLAVTYSPAENSAKLYRDGVLVDTGPAPVPLGKIIDTKNYLGKSQWQNDDFFRGLFNEFRMYRTILDDSEIAASYAMGPDLIGADFLLRSQLSGDNFTLSWGASASWCQLESRPMTPMGAQWTAATNAASFSGGRVEVAIPLADEGRLFRLAAP